jgi:hypothetical protein
VNDHYGEQFSLLGARLSPAFAARVFTVAPGQAVDYDAADWLDAIVVVERGEIELAGSSGVRRAFASGDVLCLDGLPLRCLYNAGRERAVLVAVSRTRPVVASWPSATD